MFEVFNELSLLTLVLLVISSLIAGFINTIAGGGGFITGLSLFYIGFDPMNILGTTKMQSIFGDIGSIWRYLRSKEVNYQPIFKYLLLVFVASVIGTIILSYIDIKKIIPFILLGFFIFYLIPQKKIFHIDDASVKYNNLYFLSPIIGFYNGFFGPGTGTIWSICIVKFLHLDLKKANMHTKLLNFVGNIASLLIFFLYESINYPLAFFMGLGAIVGGILGASFIIYKELYIIRIAFLFLMLSLVSASFYKFILFSD